MREFFATLFFITAAILVFLSGASWDGERRAAALFAVAALAACLAGRWLL